MRMLTAIAILFVAGCGIGNGMNGYAKCSSCGTAYRLDWGLPGQHNLSVCGSCGSKGTVYRCSKAESGWDDSREPNTGIDQTELKFVGHYSDHFVVVDEDTNGVAAYLFETKADAKEWLEHSSPEFWRNRKCRIEPFGKRGRRTIEDFR